MLKWLAKHSIQQKLFYSNTLAIAMALIPTMLIMLGYEYFAVRKASLQEIRVQADIIGESASAALAFADAETANTALSALRGAKDMQEALLILPDGKVLAHYDSERHEIGVHSAHVAQLQKLVADSTDAKEILSWTDVTIYKPIVLRSEPVGTLVLKSSLRGFYMRLFYYFLSTLAAVTIAFLSAIWIATRISKTITEPLAYLIAATERITKNQDYADFPVVHNQDEIGSLSRAFGEMVSQIQARDLGLQQLAYYDPITGLPNRHYFEERIEQAVNNAQRYGTFCYLMMIDLDDFKIVNDKQGHHVGDLLLKDVGKKLTSTMRKNDSIFRIGGDEFAIILENQAGIESVDLMASKIIKVVSTPSTLEGHAVKVGASIGISVCPSYASNVIELMSTADAAMYIAKAKGKNNFHFYQPSPVTQV